MSGSSSQTPYHTLLKKQATCEDRMIVSNNNIYDVKSYLKLIEVNAYGMQWSTVLALAIDNF